jgi:hypothetical protein
MTLKMALAEKAAGNQQQVDTLMQPFVETMSRPFVKREHAQDIMKVLDIPPAPSGRVRPLLVENDDGSIKSEQREGQWTATTQINRKKPYIYFSFPEDSGLRRINNTVRFHVTYYSDGRAGNSFRIQYDSQREAYQDSEETVIPAGDAGFKTVVIECPQARFNRRQNSRADFRVSATGQGDIYISNIEVELIK